MKLFKRLMLISGLTTILGFGQVTLDPNIENKIDELLSQMTFAEKIGQMIQYSGEFPGYEEMVREGKIGSFLNVVGARETNKIQKIAVEETRLGIPLIIGLDVIHGYRTIFPIPLANSASWDTVLIRKSAEIAAIEAASEGVHWTFAPMVDIARDPRWGRIAEGAGEDPFLGSAISRATVLGFQGNDLANPMTISACAKHYVGYGEAEGGRDYNTTDFSLRTLHEIYLPPFKAAVDAGVGTLMSAFNDIAGVPASANKYTLRDVLKTDWGFNGFVVSDWNSIGELVQHGVAANQLDAGILGLKAGVDMDMEGGCFSVDLEPFIDRGELSMDIIDDAVRRILRVKYALGLFDHPYVAENLSEKTILCPDHVQAALELARESIVLLKNEKSILPLNKSKLKKIAVIGPLADDADAALGTWRCMGNPEDVITVLEGLKTKLGNEVSLEYAMGCDVRADDRSGFKKALNIARKADLVLMIIGESADMSGEAHSRTDLDLPGVQVELVNAVAGTGKPVVLVLMNGRPLTLSNVEPNVNAILETWHLGIQHGNAVADVLLGEYNPSGKLTASFPRSVGQIPIYYNHKNTGRPASSGGRMTSNYSDSPFDPLYPFGYGLSYTTFKYSDLKVNQDNIQMGADLEISVKVKNTGKYDGDEIVQLYLRDLVGSVTRPVRELKGFRRIFLQPGEVKKVTFTLTPDDLAFVGLDNQWTIEPGEFQVFVSDLEAKFNVKK